MTDKLNDKYAPKHKVANIVCLCIFALLTVTSFTLDPEAPATAKDLFFYRLSGSMLFLPIALGLLANLDAFGIKKHIPLLRSVKKGHRVLFWFLLVFVSFLLFGFFRNFTSDEFRKALDKADITPETEYTAPAPDTDTENGSVGGTGNTENKTEAETDTDPEGYTVTPRSGSARVASPDTCGGSPNVLKPKTR